MKRVGLIGAAAALALLGVGTEAYAQTAKPKAQADTFTSRGAFTQSGSDQWGPQGARQSLQWDGKGRWGLNLDLERPVGRAMSEKDVEAGAFYRISPSLRVGGAVRLGDRLEEPRRLTPRDDQPRVRLETRFQF